MRQTEQRWGIAGRRSLQANAKALRGSASWLPPRSSIHLVPEADRIAAEYARRDASIPRERYSPAAPAQVFVRQSRERAVLSMLRRAGMLPLRGRRILDVGCGAGQWLWTFRPGGAF
jgi:2-polyprenyl-3-methyl-5-hydroxy-6-metoxy-1,4-benzoquinol methylase